MKGEAMALTYPIGIDRAAKTIPPPPHAFGDMTARFVEGNASAQRQNGCQCDTCMADRCRAAATASHATSRMIEYRGEDMNVRRMSRPDANDSGR